jgi:glyoxylase-like metal-dependent hydrolase (beta-lactamase superfamily II)
VLLVGLICAQNSGAQDRPLPGKTQVAEGVFLFQTAPYSDVGLDGNAVVVLSDSGVLVFDANGTPGAARMVLAEVRRMTKAPVRYLVMSHWHWDHWYGAEVYKQAFPNITIITHQKTRELMLGPALTFNEPGLEQGLPGHIHDIEQAVARADSQGKTAAQREALRRHLEEDRWFLAQKRGVHHTVANLTFSDSLTIYLGRRRIQVLHYDRAVTPGDAFLYLPDEKVVITGDLLVNPIPFALDAYPTGWLHSLELIDSLPATVIVPGHGDVLHDKAMLETDIAIFRELLRVGRDAKNRGLTVEHARAEANGTLVELRNRLTRNDPDQNQSFDVYVVDWMMHRIYDELNGSLTDEIAPIPEH